MHIGNGDFQLEIIENDGTEIVLNATEILELAGINLVAIGQKQTAVLDHNLELPTLPPKSSGSA